MSAFDDALSKLCATEMKAAHDDPERASAMIVAQTHALAGTIYCLLGEDKTTLSTMLDGVSAQLYKACSDIERIDAVFRSAGSS